MTAVDILYRCNEIGNKLTLHSFFPITANWFSLFYIGTEVFRPRAKLKPSKAVTTNLFRGVLTRPFRPFISILFLFFLLPRLSPPQSGP